MKEVKVKNENICLALCPQNAGLWKQEGNRETRNKAENMESVKLQKEPW